MLPSTNSLYETAGDVGKLGHYTPFYQQFV